MKKIIKIGRENHLMMKTPQQEIAMMLRDNFREIKDHILVYSLKSDEAQLLLAHSNHRELAEAHDIIYVGGWCSETRCVLEAKGWIEPKDVSPETIEKMHQAFRLWLFNQWLESKNKYLNSEDFYVKRRALFGYNPRPVPRLDEKQQLELIASRDLPKIRRYGREFYWAEAARIPMLKLADEVTLALFFQFDRLKSEEEEEIFFTSGLDLLIWEYVSQHHISDRTIKIITQSGNYHLWKFVTVENNMYLFKNEQKYGSIRKAKEALSELCTFEMFESEYHKVCEKELVI